MTAISYDVHDYDTGSTLTGSPSTELVDASLAEYPTGAVGAYRGADGDWQYLRDDEMTAYGDDARTVYIMPARKT